ncbi:MAG: hypothetical protein WCG78_07640, partial [Candidatus Omnitrophota bacterium]
MKKRIVKPIIFVFIFVLALRAVCAADVLRPVAAQEREQRSAVTSITRVEFERDFKFIDPPLSLNTGTRCATFKYQYVGAPRGGFSPGHFYVLKVGMDHRFTVALAGIENSLPADIYLAPQIAFYRAVDPRNDDPGLPRLCAVMNADGFKYIKTPCSGQALIFEYVEGEPLVSHLTGLKTRYSGHELAQAVAAPLIDVLESYRNVYEAHGYLHGDIDLTALRMRKTGEAVYLDNDCAVAAGSSGGIALLRMIATKEFSRSRDRNERIRRGTYALEPRDDLFALCKSLLCAVGCVSFTMDASDTVRLAYERDDFLVFIRDRSPEELKPLAGILYKYMVMAETRYAPDDLLGELRALISRPAGADFPVHAAGALIRDTATTQSVLRPVAAGERRPGTVSRISTGRSPKALAAEIIDRLDYGFFCGGTFQRDTSDQYSRFFSEHIVRRPPDVQQEVFNALVLRLTGTGERAGLRSLTDDIESLALVGEFLRRGYGQTLRIDAGQYQELLALVGVLGGELGAATIENALLLATRARIVGQERPHNGSEEVLGREERFTMLVGALERAYNAHPGGFEEAISEVRPGAFHLDLAGARVIMAVIEKDFAGRPLANVAIRHLLAPAARDAADPRVRDEVVAYARSKAVFVIPHAPADAEEASRMLFDEPANRENFFALMSLLRLIYPEDLTDHDARPPLRYARENGIVFQLGPNLFVTPVSEGFRRHIVYALRPDGTYLFRCEPMIPGEEEDRVVVDAENRARVTTSVCERAPGYTPAVVYNHTYDGGPAVVAAYG